MQLWDVGSHGYLRVTYEVEECEGGQGIMCTKSVRIYFLKDSEDESVHLKDDVITFNNAEISEVNSFTFHSCCLL